MTVAIMLVHLRPRRRARISGRLHCHRLFVTDTAFGVFAGLLLPFLGALLDGSSVIVRLGSYGE